MNISLSYFRNLQKDLIRKHYCQSLKKDAPHYIRETDSGYESIEVPPDESGTFFQVLHNLILSTLSINLFSTKHCKTSIEINIFYICCIS